ncbi:MAG: transglutaminase-like domain-containing protein [Nitrospiria bacterium]
MNTTVGQVRLNAVGIDGLLRGMALPGGLTQSQKQAKDAVTGLSKTLDTTLAALSRRAERQRGFDAQEHQAFLAASTELAQGLAAVQVRVLALAQEATPERRRAQLWAEAFSKRDGLLAADREIRKEFDQTEAFLREKGLPQEILDRHHAAVSDYEKNFSQIKGYFSQVDKAHRAYVSATEHGNGTAAQTAERDLESRLSAFDEFLKANVKDPPHQPLDPNNLPHRTPKPQERKPRLKKEEFAEFQTPIRLAYNGDPANLMLAQANPDVPTLADLAETIDAQFTPEIQALATQLEHNPVKICNWVRNNIDFVPTYGSIQGAQGCLVTKQCNDMDTASLLIVLLRASGIASRYVMGTIEVPIDRVMNWVGGFTGERAALDFIASGGTPVSMGSFSGGRVSTAFLEHVWVEAYVDYIPSRGAVHRQGDMWIPLDGSFKQYTYQQGMNLQATFSFDAQAFIDQIKATATINEPESYVTNINAATIQTTLRTLRDQLTTHVTQTMPNATVGDVIGGARIVTQDLPRLPATLPYRVVAQGAKRADLPGTTRHQTTFDVPGGPLSIGPSLSYAIPLPTVAGQRVTLSYVPATQTDQDVIASLFPKPHADGSPILPEELPAAFPAYLIDLKPELRVNGAVVATGEAIRMGTPQDLTITFADPAEVGTDRVTHTVTAGDYIALAFNAGGVSTKRLTDQQARLQALKAKLDAQDVAGIAKDDLIGDLLNSVIVTYFYEVDAMDKLTAQIMKAVHLRLPSEGAFILSLKTTYLFGVPKSVGPAGMTMDVPRLFYTVKARDGNPSTTWQYGLAAGPLASALEHSVPEQLLSTTAAPVEAISAVKALSLANSQGIPIYTITPLNAATVLPQMAIPVTFLNDIKNAINTGKIVTVSKTMVVFKGRAVLGYMAIDPLTGAGAYIIGGNNGGLADVAMNVLLGLVWGAFFLTGFILGLTAPPLAGLVLGTALSIIGSQELQRLRTIADPNMEFYPVKDQIGLLVGTVVGFNLPIVLGFLGASLLAPATPLIIGIIVIAFALIIQAIVFSYLFSFRHEIKEIDTSYA